MVSVFYSFSCFLFQKKHYFYFNFKGGHRVEGDCRHCPNDGFCFLGVVCCSIPTAWKPSEASNENFQNELDRNARSNDNGKNEPNGNIGSGSRPIDNGSVSGGNGTGSRNIKINRETTNVKTRLWAGTGKARTVELWNCSLYAKSESLTLCSVFCKLIFLINWVVANFRLTYKAFTDVAEPIRDEICY